MFAQFGAKFAAVRSVAEGLFHKRVRTLAGLSAGALILGGCLPATGPLLRADPADPGVPVPKVGYRSVVGPYTSMRPVSPSEWRQRNDRVAPSSKSGE
ncbi:hypothetical protein [Tardiphaga sp.]|jgi:hypothetical protein|uniref:hypothetical protein n=1 Tax=Tardiphaga sp. TaxID=1926292 RepID=UPI0037D9F346